MNASRAKGKIASVEWPKIAQRHGQGESMASIARSYGCTAPAIRYIVRRMSRGEFEEALSGEIDVPEAPAARSAEEERPIPLSDARAPKVNPLNTTFCDRVSSDIASFLVALDTAATRLTPDTAQALRESTDRLLRAGARTRLALDGVPRPL